VSTNVKNLYPNAYPQPTKKQEGCDAFLRTVDLHPAPPDNPEARVNEPAGEEEKSALAQAGNKQNADAPLPPLLYLLLNILKFEAFTQTPLSLQLFTSLCSPQRDALLPG